MSSQACPVTGSTGASTPPATCPVSHENNDDAPAPVPAEQLHDLESAMGHAPATSKPALGKDTLSFASQMFDLARAGDEKLLVYVAGGLPPDLTNLRGDTLLMLAAYHGHIKLVQGLLHPPSITGSRTKPKPADPNRLNGKGQSILAGAVFKGEIEVTRLLVEAGADPLAGTPSAEETANIFAAQATYGEMFANAPGKGRGAIEAPPEV